MKVDAILPAGGRVCGDFALEVGAEIKALIRFGSRTLLERTLEVLRGTRRIGRIAVIGPGGVEAHSSGGLADVVLPENGASGPANIFQGLEWLRQARGRYPERVLILTTDLPFVTPEAIVGFLDRCPRDLDACLPLIRRGDLEARFPGLGKRYARLRDGDWTLGCAFLIDPAAVVSSRPMIERMFAARKSLIRMAWLLGPLFIIRLLTRRLTVAHIERRGLQIFGCTGTAVLGCAPELALDIDRREDYRYAREHYAAR
jgi:hypothetical protein